MDSAGVDRLDRSALSVERAMADDAKGGYLMLMLTITPSERIRVIDLAKNSKVGTHQPLPGGKSYGN
jgi:hypothetical protein